MILKAVAYLRVSTAGQVDGDGFPRQRAAIDEYAAKHGIVIVRYFQEQGVSGTLLERPAWQQLMFEAIADDIKVVLVEKLDRLARDLIVQETLIGDMRKEGIELVSTMEPDLCSEDPSRKLIRQVFGAIAEYDRDMVVAKLRAARMRKKQATGRCEGRIPYGTKGVRERGVRRMIFRFLDEGMSRRAIAERLNKERYPAPGGGRWHPMAVGRIVTRGPA